MKPNLLTLITISVLALAACKTTRDRFNDIIQLDDEWKFKTGDSLAWAEPGLEDESWDGIPPDNIWETSGYEEYDGYAWYRVHFFLPSEMVRRSYFEDTLQFRIGKIDDTEQTFLNGSLIGQNGEVVPSGTEPGKFEGDPEAYNYFRHYKLPVDDERIRWDQENVLAIRVHDHGGGGGLYNPHPAISMVDLKDFVEMDLLSAGFDISGETYTKSITFLNSHSDQLSGNLGIRVLKQLSNETVYEQEEKITIPANNNREYVYSFDAPQTESYTIHYRLKIEDAMNPIRGRQYAPYILTPPAPEEPRINGPEVLGVGLRNPVLYRIPASGERPMSFSVEGLPYGLSADTTTGIISGRVYKEGSYDLVLKARNDLGQDEKEFQLVVGGSLALTPPLGWNSWNCWGLSIDEEKVKSAADHMVSSGLAEYGWTYINIDDGWEAEERTRTGVLMPNEKFSDMAALADDVHARGLKLGIYSSPGPLTCGGYLGSYEHELIDARTWANWGIDYLKYDWCSYSEIAPDPGLEELREPYALMNVHLQTVRRDIVYSLCQYGMGNVSEWGNEVGGHLWRTTGDIRDTWESMKEIGFGQAPLAPYAGPGGWNDPDMLVVGYVGWGPDLHPTRLTPDEQYTHISLWSLLAAPMLLGCDLSKLDDFTISLLTNHEVLAVNQDPLGRQAERVYEEGDLQVWIRPLKDGSRAIGFFNLGEEPMNTELELSKIGLEGSHTFRDLWRQKDLGQIEGTISLNIPVHGVLLTRAGK